MSDDMFEKDADVVEDLNSVQGESLDPVYDFEPDEDSPLSGSVLFEDKPSLAGRAGSFAVDMLQGLLAEKGALLGAGVGGAVLGPPGALALGAAGGITGGVVGTGVKKLLGQETGLLSDGANILMSIAFPAIKGARAIKDAPGILGAIGSKVDRFANSVQGNISSFVEGVKDSAIGSGIGKLVNKVRGKRDSFVEGLKEGATMKRVKSLELNRSEARTGVRTISPEEVEVFYPAVEAVEKLRDDGFFDGLWRVPVRLAREKMIRRKNIVGRRIEAAVAAMDEAGARLGRPFIGRELPDGSFQMGIPISEIKEMLIKAKKAFYNPNLAVESSRPDKLINKQIKTTFRVLAEASARNIENFSSEIPLDPTKYLYLKQEDLLRVKRDLFRITDWKAKGRDSRETAALLLNGVRQSLATDIKNMMNRYASSSEFVDANALESAYLTLDKAFERLSADELRGAPKKNLAHVYPVMRSLMAATMGGVAGGVVQGWSLPVVLGAAAGTSALEFASRSRAAKLGMAQLQDIMARRIEAGGFSAPIARRVASALAGNLLGEASAEAEEVPSALSIPEEIAYQIRRIEAGQMPTERQMEEAEAIASIRNSLKPHPVMRAVPDDEPYTPLAPEQRELAVPTPQPSPTPTPMPTLFPDLAPIPMPIQSPEAFPTPGNAPLEGDLIAGVGEGALEAESPSVSPFSSSTEGIEGSLGEVDSNPLTPAVSLSASAADLAPPPEPIRLPRRSEEFFSLEEKAFSQLPENVRNKVLDAKTMPEAMRRQAMVDLMKEGSVPFEPPGHSWLEGYSVVDDRIIDPDEIRHLSQDLLEKEKRGEISLYDSSIIRAALHAGQPVVDLVRKASPIKKEKTPPPPSRAPSQEGEGDSRRMAYAF